MVPELIDKLIDTIYVVSYFTNGLGFRPKFYGDGYENLKYFFALILILFLYYTSTSYWNHRHKISMTGTDWKPFLVKNTLIAGYGNVN